jgi:type I restriction enzyme S subunit
MELKPGYKRTPIGVVPCEWIVRRLGDLAIIKDGTHQTPRYVSVGVPFYSVEHITSGDFENTKFISESEHRFLTRAYKIERGDVLMTRIGSIGECCLIDWDVNASFYVSLALLKLKGVDAKFFVQYSQSSSFKNEVDKRSLPLATPKKINLGPISEILVPVPSNEEQRSISEVLADIDSLIGQLDRLITKKHHVKHAAMQELLTGRTRLPGFAGDWTCELLGELAHIKTGSRNNEDKKQDGEYPFFVRSATVERINTYSHDCEAILVPGEGQIGDIFHYISGRFDVHQRVYAITRFVPRVNARYLHLFMSTHFGAWAMQNTVKATVDSLRLPTFQKFAVHLPPTIEEQDAIATVLTDMAGELAVLESRRSKTQHLKQAMMQELLTGRTRLVDTQGAIG